MDELLAVILINAEEIKKMDANLTRQAAQQVNSYFCAKLSAGCVAGDVFKSAKLAAMKVMQEKLDAISALSFQDFANAVLDPNHWTEGTIYKPEDDG